MGKKTKKGGIVGAGGRKGSAGGDAATRELEMGKRPDVVSPPLRARLRRPGNGLDDPASIMTFSRLREVRSVRPGLRQLRVVKSVASGRQRDALRTIGRLPAALVDVRKPLTLVSMLCTSSFS